MFKDYMHHVINDDPIMKGYRKNSFPFYEAQEDLPGVKHFTNSLIHLPSHHYMEQEDLDIIKRVLENEQ